MTTSYLLEGCFHPNHVIVGHMYTTHRAAKEERLLAQRLVRFGLLATDVVEREENVVSVGEVGGKLNLNLFVEFRLSVGGKDRRRLMDVYSEEDDLT